MVQFSTSGTMASGVTKEELADFVKQESKRSKAIDRQLTSEQSKNKTEIILLLLGTFTLAYAHDEVSFRVHRLLNMQFGSFYPSLSSSCALPLPSSLFDCTPSLKMAIVATLMCYERVKDVRNFPLINLLFFGSHPHLPQ